MSFRKGAAAGIAVMAMTATAATVNATTDAPAAPAAPAVAAQTVTQSTAPLSVQDQARQTLAAEGLDEAQFQCLSNVVERESNWNHKATNSSSGAFGLFQALPGSKMASAGADWQANPATQVEWGVKYMKDRYGSPCGAWDFWQDNHWY